MGFIHLPFPRSRVQRQCFFVLLNLQLSMFVAAILYLRKGGCLRTQVAVDARLLSYVRGCGCMFVLQQHFGCICSLFQPLCVCVFLRSVVIPPWLNQGGKRGFIVKQRRSAICAFFLRVWF